MKGLRIGLVSAYPPSTRPLSEYAGHLVTALCATGRLDQVCVLADRAPETAAHRDTHCHVIPCWTFGDPLLALSVIQAARPLKLDALWFNLHMTSGGNTRMSWFGGVCAPAIARAAGFKVIVTLHNMLGLTDLDESGIKARSWDIAAAHVATRSLGYADVVCTLRPEYVSLLKSRYGMQNVVYMPHGTLGSPVAVPSQNDGTHILAFGHFGTYKRLESLIEAVEKLSGVGVAIRLTIAGIDSRHTPGYLKRLAIRHRSMTNLQFLGYVPEEDVPALFQSATVCVLPYATLAGMSGVAILAAMHGVPIIASDIAAFRSLERDGLRMRLFHWHSADSLARTIMALLSVPEDRQRLARENLSFASLQRMSAVAAGYVGLIEQVLSEATPSRGKTRPTGSPMNRPCKMT